MKGQIIRKCVACDGCLIELEKYKFKSNIFRGVYNSEYLFCCSQCKLVQADCGAIDASLLDEYYAIHYRHSAGIGLNRNERETLLYQVRGFALAKMIAELSNAPISVLEVGAGLGFNLVAVKKLFLKHPFTLVSQTKLRHHTSRTMTLRFCTTLLFSPTCWSTLQIQSNF